MYNCTYIIPIERLDMWILGFQKILIESLKYFEISHLQLGTRIYRANVCTYYLLSRSIGRVGCSLLNGYLTVTACCLLILYVGLYASFRTCINVLEVHLDLVKNDYLLNK